MPGRPPPTPDRPCSRCIDAYDRGVIRREAVMPLDKLSAMNPLARAGWEGSTCQDCASAEGLEAEGLDFDAARRVIANDRQEDLRAPGISGLIAVGRMRPTPPGGLEAHLAWLDREGVE